MPSALTFIFLGNAYNFFGNTSLPASNQIPIIYQPTTVPSITLDKREDYHYTPGIGGHKVHNRPTNWDNARLMCQEEGGDLAIINSASEAEILVRLLAASGPHIGAHDVWTFIGFHDLFEEGQYETVDGQSLSDAGYNEWVGKRMGNSGEPIGGSNKNCGTINRQGKLNDIDCDEHHGFVCELPNPAQGTSITEPLSLPE